jgi:hypothetical protein
MDTNKVYNKLDDIFFIDELKCDTRKKKWLQELIDNQLQNVRQSKRLYYIDLQNIINNVESSLFDDTKCCIWNGKMSIMSYPYKNTYMKIMYKNRKKSLQRLLYENYIGEILHTNYIKYTCGNNKTRNCCNINHMTCISDNKFKKETLKRNFKEKKKNNIIKYNEKSSKNTTKIYLSFD